MEFLLFPFHMLLDVVSPFRVLAPVALIVLVVAVVLLAISALIRIRRSRIKQRLESSAKCDAAPEESGRK